MSPGAAQGLSEPPEGVLAGESVPPENQEDDIAHSKVQRVAAMLKSKPRYAGRTDAEREEAARRIIEQTED